MPVLRRWPIPVGRDDSRSRPRSCSPRCRHDRVLEDHTATAFRAAPAGTAAPDHDPAVARRADATRPAHGEADRARPAVDRPRDRRRPVALHLSPGRDQDPPIAVARLAGQTYRLHQQASGRWTLAATTPAQVASVGREGPLLAGLRLTDLAPSLGLDFQQGAFHYGMSSDTKAMMGGGVCWLDVQRRRLAGPVRRQLLRSADTSQWEAHGGLPRTCALRERPTARSRTSAPPRMPICPSRATAASPRI